MALFPIRSAAAAGLLALTFAAPARAQSGGWLDAGRSSYSGASGADGQSYSYYDSSRAAYDQGYREGVKQGEHDGRKSERYRYEDDKMYQRADKGYRREYGSLERYRQAFRDGYAAGYTSGYERFAPAPDYRYGDGRAVPRGSSPDWSRGPSTYPYPASRPNPGRFPQGGTFDNPAFQNGENDGYEKGLEDAQKHRSFDPARHDWYRDGDRRYDRQYGTKEQYASQYREGFRDGYERGFSNVNR